MLAHARTERCHARGNPQHVQCRYSQIGIHALSEVITCVRLLPYLGLKMLVCQGQRNMWRKFNSLVLTAVNWTPLFKKTSELFQPQIPLVAWPITEEGDRAEKEGEGAVGAEGGAFRVLLGTLGGIASSSMAASCRCRSRMQCLPYLP